MRKIVFLLLFAVIFTIPWETIFYLQDFTLTKGIGLAAAALGLIVVLMGGHTRRLIAIHYLMVLFTLWCCVGVLWSVKPDATLLRITTSVQLLGLSWMIWEFAPTVASQMWLMRAYILGGCVGLATQFAVLARGSGYRVTGAGMNANDYALALSITIPFAVYFAIERTKTKKLLASLAYWAYAAFAGLGVLVTGSRMGLIILLFTTGLVLITYLRRQALVPIAFLGIAALSTWMFVKWAPQKTVERMGATGEALGGSWTMRRPIIVRGLEVAREHLLLGTGGSTFAVVSGIVLDKPGGQLVEGACAHNSYLGVLVEFGVPGLMMFLAILAIAFSYAWKLPRADQLVWLIVLAGWSIGAIALTAEDRKPLWFLLGLLTSRYGTTQEMSRAVRNMAAAARSLPPRMIRWRPKNA